MSRVIYVLVGIASLSGCGNTLDPLAWSPNRLTVNLSLLRKCEAAFPGNPVTPVELLLITFEAARTEEEVSYERARAETGFACLESALPQACITCSRAIIDQVYGR